MAEVEDASLVRRCLEGETACFDQLIVRYQKALFNLAYRMVGDYDEALDITQTALLKAFRKLRTYDPGHKFFSWIYRIVINEALNSLHRRRSRVGLPASLVSGDASPAEEHERSRIGQEVQGALGRLQPHHRLTIILRHFLELSYAEMGEVLGLPEKTVKSRLYSARQQLRELLIREGVGQP